MAASDDFDTAGMLVGPERGGANPSTKRTPQRVESMMDRSMIVMEVLLLEYGSLEWDRVIDRVYCRGAINTKDNERKSSVSLRAEENKRDSISPRLSKLQEACGSLLRSSDRIFPSHHSCS